MSIDDTMTPIMNKVRKLTGLTDKISLSKLDDLMDHFDLHVNPNILGDTSYVITKSRVYPEWSSRTPSNALEPGVYTFSWRAKTSGTNTQVRIRIFDSASNMVAPGTYRDFESGGNSFPLTSNKQSFTFTVPKDNNQYHLCIYGSGYNNDHVLIPQDDSVTFYDCKLEYGDLATPLQEVGGVTSNFLLAVIALLFKFKKEVL